MTPQKEHVQGRAWKHIAGTSCVPGQATLVHAAWIIALSEPQADLAEGTCL